MTAAVERNPRTRVDPSGLVPVRAGDRDTLDRCLTPHQERVLRLRARGMTNAEVAYELGIGIQTDKNHQAHIYARLNVTNLVAAFRALGWMTVPA